MAKSDRKDADQYLEGIKADIRSGEIARVYLFHGEETYLVRRFAGLLASKILAPGAEGFDRILFDAGGMPSKLDLRQVAAEIATPPFLSRRKLVVLRNSGLFGAERRGGDRGGDGASEASEDRDGEGSETDDRAGSSSAGKDTAKGRLEALVALISAVPDSACLLFLERSIDRRVRRPIEAIEAHGRVVEFALQSVDSLRLWISRELSSSGATIDREAAESLLSRCGDSMQAIEGEIEKLRLYCTGSGTTRITLSLVDELCIPDLAGSVFDMTDAIGQGRPGRALDILETLIARKEPVQLLMYMLARHVRNLICAKETADRARLASELGIPPFLARKLDEQARNFTIERLEDLHTRCFEADAASKSGRIPDRVALETLLASTPR